MIPGTNAKTYSMDPVEKMREALEDRMLVLLNQSEDPEPEMDQLARVGDGLGGTRNAVFGRCWNIKPTDLQQHFFCAREVLQRNSGPPRWMALRPRSNVGRCLLE